jgi:hypothetical protein
VQYKNQVVAKIRGAEDKTADSLRTLQLMQAIAANAAMQAEDSAQTIMPDNTTNTADSSMIQQSMQREDNFETSNAISDKPLQPLTPTTVLNPTPVNPSPLKTPAPAKPVVAKPTVPAATKPEQKKPIPNPNPVKKPTSDKPKVVMPVKNDY